MRINPAVKGRLTRITTGNVGRPRLSADGSTVVYSRWNGENWDIERHRGGQMESVSKNPRHDVAPQVSGDGDVVVWSRHNPDSREGKGSWDIYRWESGREELFAGSGADETDPDISTDGKTIVYTHDDLDKPIGFDIHRCRDGQCEELTSDWPVDTNAMLADGGERVVFRRKIRFDGGDLWLRDQSGTVKQLTDDGLAEQRPTFSADGMTLAYSKSLDGENEDIFFHNIGNGQLEKIGDPETNEREPELSADGSVLVFTQSGNGTSSIVVRDPEGLHTLTEDGFHRSPAVSADGKVIAWVGVGKTDSSQNAIYKLELD